MSIDAGAVLATARKTSGLSARQAAILAGLAPSTITRIERGEIDPSLSVFEKALTACGYRLDDRLIPNIDLDAVRAARRMLEADCNLSATDRSKEYERRWEAAGLLDAGSELDMVSEIAFRAAQQASLSHRPGARRYAFRDWRLIAGSLANAGQSWALTGGYAATFYTSIATVNWAVFYVDDVEQAATVADLEPLEVGRQVTLIPFDEITRSGVQVLDDGMRLASYWQIIIDCFAGNGRMPAQAEAMIDLAVIRARRATA
jgi:transcriptional regulator with XRE-family HTH domain